MLNREEERMEQYLTRIGIYESVIPHYECLKKIQQQHMLHVPFENLDIIAQEPIQLDRESLYNKIVGRNRGGYCYELNGLLAWFLEQVGFQVSLLSGKVKDEDGTYGPEFDHMLLMVQLDEALIVDVGFGDSVRSPLPLSGEVVRDVSGSYRVKSKENTEAFYFQKRLNEEWVCEYEFTLTPRSIQDFQEMNVYQQTSPHSHFTQKLIASVATVDGRYSISDYSFIETTPTGKTRRLIESNDERVKLLQHYFGLVV